MANPLVLIVDDEVDTTEGLVDFLALHDYQSAQATNLKEAKEKVAGTRFDAVLLDLRLPDGNALDWLPELRDQHPHLAVIVITGQGDDIPTAVEAMQRGADQFLTKPVNPDQLTAALKKCIQLERLKKHESVRQRLAREEGPFFGESEAAKRMWELAGTAAENNSVIMIQGETGSGKGVLARWIHDNSSRCEGDFVEVNCSSLGGDLLASELFGHRKGAFTSAVEDREGLIEIADQGTLFLDEIGDMDLPVQAQLLKVLEERTFRRVGETRNRRSDFRLICATNKDLPAETEHGRFRSDLYYRIHVFPIEVPPLRRRMEDLPALAESILREFGRPHPALSQDVLQMLHQYAWPGNIRELRNVLERACLLSSGEPLAPSHFSGLGGGASAPAQEPILPDEDWGLDAQEARHIQRCLQAFDGKVPDAAQALGVSRATLYRKLKRHGILQEQM